MAVWQQLSASAQPRLTAPIQPMVAFAQPSPQNASKAKKKGPVSGENIPSAVDRMIQPQLPFNFPSVNSTSDFGTDQGVTASVLGGPPKKKRGRPSKVEHEAKVAEAAARGETYQPTPKRKKAPRSSLQDTSNAGMATPSMADVGTTSEDSTGKARIRKPKAGIEVAGDLASEPTARSFAPDQMQIEDGKSFKNAIHGMQASEVEIRGGLSAGIRENAEGTAPDTVQSTMTLRHDSAPHNDFTSYQGSLRDLLPPGEQRYL